MNDIKIYIQDIGFADVLDVAIVLKHAGERSIAHVDNENHSVFRFDPLPDNLLPMNDNNNRPTFRISYEILVEFYNKLDTYFRKRGIKPDNQSYIEGKLDAMTAHLHDMRVLVMESGKYMEKDRIKELKKDVNAIVLKTDNIDIK